MKLIHSTKTYVYKSLEEAENHIDIMLKEGWLLHNKEHGLGRYNCIYKKIAGDFQFSVEYWR